MSFFDDLKDQSKEEHEKLKNNPERWEKEYQDASGEFLPPEVGQLISEFQRGQFDYEKFLHLSTEKRNLFLEYISENFPVEIDIQEKTA